MKKLAFANLNRHFVGSNFEECLTKFTDAAQMARCTGISHSSINHVLNGRPVVREATRKRYEKQCRLYLGLPPIKTETPHIPKTIEWLSAQAHATPTQAAMDLDQTKVFLVSVPAAKADKLKTVLAMFGAEIVEVD